MVLYFSATGNSEYTAKQIAAKIDDECINLFEKIKKNDFSEINSEKPFVFVCPTFAWNVPLFFRDWIRNTSFSGDKKAYFVMTCGADIGGAGKHNASLCKEKGFEYKGTGEIILPDNYIYASTMDTREEALETVEKCQEKLETVASTILKGDYLCEKWQLLDPMKSGFVSTMFNRFSKMVSKNFYADENCIGCGKCEKLCVMNNIIMENGKPRWGENCSQCYACIHRCPKKSVQIKHHTEGKDRYVFPGEQ